MNEKHLRRKVLDADGNPILNRFGHAITPELTANEIAYVEEQLAAGRPLQTVANELETTRTRIIQIRDNKDSHDRMMEYQRTILIPQQISNLIEFVASQSEQIDELAKQMSALVIHQKAMNRALRYKQIGMSDLRKQVRDLKEERKELRALIHRQTGHDIGPHKRQA